MILEEQRFADSKSILNSIVVLIVHLLEMFSPLCKRNIEGKEHNKN